MEDRSAPKYGLSDYDPIPFSNFSRDFGKLSASLSQPYYIDVTNDVQNFLSAAESLWNNLNLWTAEKFSSSPEYEAIRQWLDEETSSHSISDTGGADRHVVPVDQELSSPGTFAPLLSADQRRKLKGLDENLTVVYENIKNFITGYGYQKQTTYDSFKNLTPLIEGFIEKERGIIPKGVSDDWDESIKCLKYGQFRSGSMMTFRAAEGMLRYYYWNITGELPEKTVRDRTGNTILIKMGWQEILKNLEEKRLNDIAETINLDRVQRARNAFAHGDFFSSPTNPETARTNFELCKGVIQGLVTALLSRGKALRVCVNKEVTFDTALAIWMLDKYFGIVDYQYQERGSNMDEWYSYNIGLGGKYSQTPECSCSQTLFNDLRNWNVITTPSDINRLQSLVITANVVIDYGLIDEFDPNIHSVIKYINKLSNGNTAKGYTDSLKLIGKIFDAHTELDQPQQMEKIRHWVGVAI